MKELRFEAADGVWRVAFAFDSRRCAVLFASGDKSGVSARRFYRDLIRRAYERFDTHRERQRRRGNSNVYQRTQKNKELER